MQPQTEWPASKVELWPIERLHPYPKNSRTHPTAQIKLLASLMQRHGVDQPIVVDSDGVILKGHARRLAAMEAGFTEFPTVVHTGLSETEKTALRIEDNQVAVLSGWDDEVLRAEIADLKFDDYDLKLLGFDDGQIFAFSMDRQKGENDPDAEWAGMPEFAQANLGAFRSIIVHFTNQAGMKKFAKLLKVEIPPKAKFVWYPRQPRQNEKENKYES
jgi:hypothetical protein